MKSFVVILTAFTVIVSELALNYASALHEQQPSASNLLYKDPKRKIYGSQFLVNITQLRNDMDIVISPSGLWCAWMTLMPDSLYNRLDQTSLRERMQISTSTVEVFLWQAMYVDSNEIADQDYLKTLKNFYGVNVLPLDYKLLQEITDVINLDIRTSTRSLIDNLVKVDYVRKAKLLFISILYFRGQWKIPFDPNQTQEKVFHDMNGEVRGTVDLMFTQGLFKYMNLPSLKATVLELPYGAVDRASMLVVLPDKGVALNDVLQIVDQNGIGYLVHELLNQTLSNVTVYFPRFTTTTNLQLTKKLFDGKVANIMHIAKIIVSEHGTGPGTGPTVALPNKMLLPELSFDRPFSYFILDKSSTPYVLLWAGKFMNPNKNILLSINETMAKIAFERK